MYMDGMMYTYPLLDGHMKVMEVAVAAVHIPNLLGAICGDLGDSDQVHRILLTKLLTDSYKKKYLINQIHCSDPGQVDHCY